MDRIDNKYPPLVFEMILATDLEYKTRQLYGIPKFLFGKNLFAEERTDNLRFCSNTGKDKNEKSFPPQLSRAESW